MLMLSQESDFQKMAMWTTCFLRSLPQVPTPSISALWSGSVNLIHVKYLWKQCREVVFVWAEEDWGSPVWFHWCIICMVSHKRMGDSYRVVLFKSFPSPPIITTATASPGRGLVCVIYMQFPWAEVDRRKFHTDFCSQQTPSSSLRQDPVLHVTI